MKHHENLLKYENEAKSEGKANSGGPQISDQHELG